jgi:hypothetical protein
MKSDKLSLVINEQRPRKVTIDLVDTSTGKTHLVLTVGLADNLRQRIVQNGETLSDWTLDLSKIDSGVK